MAENQVAATKRRIREAVDAKLQEYVVDPMARAGWPNAGAALATVPSTAAEYALDKVPESPADVATMALPVKGGTIAKALPEGVRKQVERLAREKGLDPAKLLQKADQMYGGNQMQAAEALHKKTQAGITKKAMGLAEDDVPAKVRRWGDRAKAAGYADE